MIVSGPILPIYISNVIRSFPGKLRLEVIPMESPTVPNAEKASKAIFSKLKGSMSMRMNITVITKTAASVINEVASR